MNDPSDIPDGIQRDIDRCLHGEMTPEEAQAFELRAQADPDLAQRLETERRLTVTLTRAFKPPLAPLWPAGVGLLTGGEGDGGSAGSTPSSAHVDAGVAPATPSAANTLATWWGSGLAGLLWRKAMFVGGVVVAAGVITASVLIWNNSGTPPATPGSAYQGDLASGFVPTDLESDAGQLSVTISTKLGRSVTVPEVPGVEYLGLRTGFRGTPLSVGLMARIADKPILLVLDLAQTGTKDSPVSTTADAEGGPGVYRHERTLGGLRLVEISGSSTPLLVPAIDVGR